MNKTPSDRPQVEDILNELSSCSSGPALRRILDTRGKEPCRNREEVCAYILQYLNDHRLWCYNKFVTDALKKWDLRKQRISIYDWGCGPATATGVFLEKLLLTPYHASVTIESINLVDPSEAAMKVGEEIVRKIWNGNCPVTVRKFDGIHDFKRTANARTYGHANVHLFFYVLDVLYSRFGSRADWDFLCNTVKDNFSDEGNFVLAINPTHKSGDKYKDQVNQFAIRVGDTKPWNWNVLGGICRTGEDLEIFPLNKQ